MGFYRGPKIVTDGLVFAVDAGSERSYSGSGTNWADLSGNANNVTLTNGPVFNTGGYFEFDGTDDFGYNGSTSLEITGNVTMNAWIRHDGSGNSVGNYMSQSQNSGYRMRRQGASGNALWIYASGNSVSGGAIYDNIWYMVTAVFSSSGLRAYINDDLVASNTTAYASGTFGGGLYIGAYAVALELFGGDISSCKIYNKALSAAEVTQNFNAQKSRFGL